MGKSKADIESVLRWAYREQLPLKYTSSADGIWDKIGGTGIARDDSARRDGTSAQRYPQLGLPHPDADLIEQHVNALAPASIDWVGLGLFLMGELVGLLHLDEVNRLGEFNTRAWVTQHANMGTRPRWKLDDLKCYPVKADRGPGYKLIGECYGRNKYSPWSYCPLEWRPTHLDIAEARAQYLVWWRGLASLAKSLKGELETWEPLAPEASPDPWRTADVARTCYLVGSTEQWGVKPLPLSLPRPRAGALKRTPRFGPVTLRTG